VSVLLAEGCNILKDLSASATASVRTTIVRCILGTDMKHHTRLLADLAVVCSVDDFASVADGRQLLLTMIIHGSDLGNLAAPREVALKWVDRVCEEFTDQALGLFVPPHIINLEEEVMRCRLQMNFLDYLVLPLWSTITGILTDARPWLDHLRANREYFGERAALLSARRREPSHAGEDAADPAPE